MRSSVINGCRSVLRRRARQARGLAGNRDQRGFKGVRLLDVGASGSDLLADSRLATSLTSPQQQTGSPSKPLDTSAASSGEPGSVVVPTASLPFPHITLPATPTPPALACQEDSIITPDGSAVVCGAIRLSTRRRSNGYSLTLKRAPGPGSSSTPRRQERSRASSGTGRSANVGALSIDVLWSNPSGSVLIAVIPTAGDGRVGVISGNTFTPIAAQIAGVAALSGTGV